MSLKTMWSSLLAAGLLAPGLAAAETQAQQPIQLMSPASGSGLAGPFPGFSWSWHPAAFKDTGRTVEYEIQVSSNETDWPNGLYASELIVRNNTIMDSCVDNPTGPATIGFIFSGYKRDATSIGPRRLLIEGNTIESCPSPEIMLSWVRNAVVRNNRAKKQSGAVAPAITVSPNSTEVIMSHH